MNQFFQWLANLFQGVKFWTIVMPWERGLRVRLGRWIRLWEPGLHWNIPYADHVRVINTRVRIAAIPCTTVTTKDGKTVTIAGCVAFRITDPYKILLTIQQPEHAASALGQAAIAGYVVEREVAEISVGELEKAALSALKASSLDGLEFEFVKAVDFAIVRTYRLLQENWRPSTECSNLDPPKGPY